MLDYIFFAPILSDKFKDHLTKVGIDFECDIDESFGSVQGEIVSIADETSDAVLVIKGTQHLIVNPAIINLWQD
jgi:hypothetical protein